MQHSLCYTRGSPKYNKMAVTEIGHVFGYFHRCGIDDAEMAFYRLPWNTLKTNLSAFPNDYEITNHNKRGRCKDCYQILKNYSSDTSGKILFGEKTTREEIPWHVGIHNFDNSLQCGGTLISPSKILSAAHCFGQFPEIGDCLTSGYEYRYKAIVGNTKVDFQIDY